MSASPEYEELLRQYRELQLRVTRFSATEQALINTRDRLDHELEIYKRLNRYHTEALRCDTDADFFQLMAEAIVDVFELECSIIMVTQNDICSSYQEGVGPEMSQHVLQLKNHKGEWVDKEMQSLIVKEEGDLAHFGLAPFSFAVLSEIQDQLLDIDVRILGLISKENQLSYSILEPRHQAIFNVFIQQFHGLVSNRVKSKEIELQLAKIQTSEQELKKLSLIATKTKNGVIITDTFGRIEWVNDAFSNISGYHLRDVIGKKPKDLLQGRDTDERSKALLKDALWNKRDIELTIVNHDVNGKPYYNQLEIISVFDDQGKHVNFIALQKDITAEILSQQEILRMNSRFELITQQSKIGIWEFNAQSQEVVWNSTLYQIYGVEASTDQDLRALWHQAVYPEDKEMIDEHLKGLLNGQIQVQQEEYRIVRRTDGEVRNLNTLTIAERDLNGELIRLVGTAQDVTEAKSLLKERDASVMKMNELKLFYEGILNHSPGDIFVFDDKGFLIYCNKPSSEWKCWWDPSQGQSIFDSEFPFTNRQKLIIQAIQLSIAQQSVVRVEDVFEDGSGDTSYFLQSILPYLNTHQTLEHIIISGVEITEQKKNEHVLQTKNAELKKINAELDSFVYSISHDLRSPLLSIKGILALVLSNEGLDPSSVQFLKMAEDSVGRLDGTIQEILEYSRNSRLELEKSSVHVAQMIQEILDDLQFSHDLPHAWKVMAEGVGEISTDKARLKVLLRNIIGNSVKYRREGVVNEVEVKVNLDHGRVYFEVKDNGEGISQESIKRVFDMFYRGTTNSQGTGLGLYICKEIIGKLGGEISIESEKGVGTSVYFWIPLND